MSEQKSILDAAKEYEKTSVQNISELEKVSVDMVIEEKEFGEGDKAFSALVFKFEGGYYRVPKTVLEQLKALVLSEKVKPFEYFNVIRTGTTMQDTVYLVNPQFDK